jgi:hypothetical protein
MARIRAAGADLYTDQSSGGSGSASPMRYVSNWTLDGSTDFVDVTAFGDANKVQVAGLSSAQGSIKGFYDDTSTTGSGALYAMATSGVARKTYFYAKAPSTSGPYWHGTANWSISYEFDIAGAAAISGSWTAASSLYFVG